VGQSLLTFLFFQFLETQNTKATFYFEISNTEAFYQLLLYRLPTQTLLLFQFLETHNTKTTLNLKIFSIEPFEAFSTEGRDWHMAQTQTFLLSSSYNIKQKQDRTLKSVALKPNVLGARTYGTIVEISALPVPDTN
jgi:hypothetical protein